MSIVRVALATSRLNKLPSRTEAVQQTMNREEIGNLGACADRRPFATLLSPLWLAL
jgi:hypothetical protein